MPARLLQLFYDVGYTCLMLLGLPFFLFKMATSRRWRSGLRERLGGVEPRAGDRRCLWIHGVSVGEVLAAQTLVARIREEMPDWEVVISTTTRTGQDVARRTYPDCRIFYYPLDLSFATGRCIRRIRPDAVLLVELEIWPNFLLATSRQDVPVFLVNGRITERSLKGYKRLQWLVPEPMDRIGLYCVQTPAYRDRFLSLGVPEERVFVTGTMKFDTVTAEESKDVRRTFLEAFGFEEGDWVLIAGSTHDGEEKLVLDAFRAVADRDPRARLVLAPRHLERLADVEAAVREMGFEPVRRTDGADPGGAGPRRVVVLDTMGELASSYSAADVVYVGGSLVPHGGQNVLEPAGLAKPVLTGPHCWNFDEVVEALAESGGLEMVQDAEGLKD
ncbi:MAG: 3-deoxy-D-manno-octulosonic acid transferase, partial [Planctomycetota bacterium]